MTSPGSGSGVAWHRPNDVVHIACGASATPSVVITMRQLLNQTGGLIAWAGTIDLSRPGTTLEQRVRAVADVEPVSVPGSEFHYCNKNYAILTQVVEEATDMPYADYLQQHILDPLDMDASRQAFQVALCPACPGWRGQAYDHDHGAALQWSWGARARRDGRAVAAGP